MTGWNGAFTDWYYCRLAWIWLQQIGSCPMCNILIMLNLLVGPLRMFLEDLGARQGCPLSRLLFLLNIEWLSKLIESTREMGAIEGISISTIIRITQLLFVDVVMLFNKGILDEWHRYKCILEKYCRAYGMLISDKNIYYTVSSGWRIYFRTI